MGGWRFVITLWQGGEGGGGGIAGCKEGHRKARGSKLCFRRTFFSEGAEGEEGRVVEEEGTAPGPLGKEGEDATHHRDNGSPPKRTHGEKRGVPREEGGGRNCLGKDERSLRGFDHRGVAAGKAEGVPGQTRLEKRPLFGL